MGDVDTKALLAEMIRKQSETNAEKAVETAFSLYMVDRLDTHVQAITALLAASAASDAAAQSARIELERERSAREASHHALLEKEAEESRLALAAKARREEEKDELELVLLRSQVDALNERDSIAARKDNGASPCQY